MKRPSVQMKELVRRVRERQGVCRVVCGEPFLSSLKGLVIYGGRVMQKRIHGKRDQYLR